MVISSLIGGIIAITISLIGGYYYIFNWDWASWSNTFFSSALTVGIGLLIFMFLGIGIAVFINSFRNTVM